MKLSPILRETRVNHFVSYKQVSIESRCRICANRIQLNTKRTRFPKNDFRSEQIKKYRKFFLETRIAKHYEIGLHSLISVSISKNVVKSQGESILINCLACQKTLYFLPAYNLFKNRLYENMKISYYTRIFENPFIKICKYGI